MKILIAGDLCPKYRAAELLEQERLEEMLGEVKPVIEQADYSIVNFECPVVKGNANPIPKCGPNLRTTAKAVDLIKYAGFKAVTLANNHFLDYGEEGVRKTLETLDNAGIAHLGGGINLAEASKTMYIEGDAGKVAIINCCEHEFSIATEMSAGSNPLNPVEQWYAIQDAKKQATYVIIIVHGGAEHFQYPSLRMQETYRFFIDCGASAVVNHHQHCLSGYEVYKGAPIIYGLGNFLFDHATERHTKWNEGYMVMLSLENRSVKMDAIPYRQCDEDVTVSLMTKDEHETFLQGLDSINKVILHKNLLNEVNLIFQRRQSDNYLRLLEPYNNKILRGLRRLGLLPSVVNKKKRLQILNYIMCESHVERFISSLKDYE